MKPVARIVRVTAKALTDPQPVFVALVGAGANQTPWLHVKAAEEEVKKEELAMKVAQLRQDGWEIAGFAFDKTKFDTREKVDAWLKDGGYTVEVGEEDGAFVAKDAAAGDAVRTIKTDDGVTVALAFRAAAAQQPAQTEEQDKAPAGASEVGLTDPASGAGAGETTEGAEKGVDTNKEPKDVAALAIAELIKSAPLSEDRRKSLYNVGSLHDVIIGLKWLIQDMQFDVLYGGSAPTEAEQAVIARVKGVAGELIGALALLFQVEVEQLYEVFKAAAEKANAEGETAPEVMPEAAPAAAEPEQLAADPAPQSDAGQKQDTQDLAALISAAVEQAVSKAVAPITESVEGLTGRMTAAEARASEAEERAESQTRRSADVDAISGSTGAKGEEDDIGDLQLRSALGVSRAPANRR